LRATEKRAGCEQQAGKKTLHKWDCGTPATATGLRHTQTAANVRLTAALICARIRVDARAA
jgi:hypothetical protein